MRKPDYRLSLTRYRCGHERTAANTSFGECRTCKRERQTRYRRNKQLPESQRDYRAEMAQREPAAHRAKREPTAVRWIVAPDFPAILAECREALERAMAEQHAKVGRPRKAA